MHCVVRLLAVFLLAGALSLGSGPVLEEGTLTAGDGTAAASGSGRTAPYGHGEHDGGKSDETHHHCKAAFCMSVLVIHGNHQGLPISETANEIPAPAEDSHNGSAHLDNDPPVPRFSV